MNRIKILGLSLCSLALATAGLTACGGGVDTSSVHSTTPTTTPTTTSAKVNPYTAGDMSGAHDQNFLLIVKASHIPYGTDQDILDAGHVTCFSFDQGESLDTVVAQMDKFYNATRYQEGTLIGASIGNFCPKYLHLLQN